MEEETALSYKQQLKAIKELEQAGYIKTRVMGVSSKKYFSITDKIVQELLSEVNPSSDKGKTWMYQQIQRQYSKKVNPAFPKGKP